MIKCLACDTTIGSFRNLRYHVASVHDLTSQEYVNRFLGIGTCDVCGEGTKFKNINIGYRKFCSPKCTNKAKASDPAFRNKLSLSQKGKPRKKHSEETKILISKISKDFWKENHQRMVEIFNESSHKERQSKKSSENYKSKRITYVNGIRCESKVEELFVDYCIGSDFKIERFHFYGQKSIHISNRWYVPDFLVDNDIIVDVKDFHPWFKEEIKNGMSKYETLNNWCNSNGYIFMLWFKDLGFQKLEDWKLYEKYL